MSASGLSACPTILSTFMLCILSSMSSLCMSRYTIVPSLAKCSIVRLLRGFDPDSDITCSVLGLNVVVVCSSSCRNLCSPRVCRVFATEFPHAGSSTSLSMSVAGMFRQRASCLATDVLPAPGGPISTRLFIILF